MTKWIAGDYWTALLIVGAIGIAALGRDGWGYFLFAALIMYVFAHGGGMKIILDHIH